MFGAGYDADAYHVLVLRMWRERAACGQHPPVWRFLVENTRTRQQHGFGSLEEVIVFLQAQVDGIKGHQGGQTQ